MDLLWILGFRDRLLRIEFVLCLNRGIFKVFRKQTYVLAARKLTKNKIIEEFILR